MDNHKKIIITIIFLFSSLFFSLINLRAQNIDKTSGSNLTDNTKPELYEHSFITNSLVDGPFVNTYFRLTSGIGSSSDYDVPLVINGNEVEGLFGNITFGTLNVKYQQKIKDWLAFSASVDMKGRLGSETISLLTQGINLGTSMNIAWTIKAHESKKLMLSGLLVISNASVTLFNLSAFIERVIQNGGITAGNKLVKTYNLTSGFTGMKAAYAFSKTFGFLGKFHIGYGETITSVNKGYFDAGVSFDADLKPKYSVPIGFAIGYNWNNFTQSETSFTNPQNILFKINYTGRKDFDLGVEMNAQFLSFKDRNNKDINLSVLYMKAGIAYYF